MRSTARSVASWRRWRPRPVLEGYLVAITADHGMPRSPWLGARAVTTTTSSSSSTTASIPREAHHALRAENGQLYIDEARARTLGVSMAQIRDLLLTQPFILYAYTEDEVARVRLP